MKYLNYKALFIFCLLLLFFIPISAQGTLEISRLINSEMLNQEELFSVYLPEHYNDSTLYPSLYLLHGHGGNENSWIKQGNIDKILDSLILCKQLPEVIVVFPNGRNSYFINDYANKYPFEDYFTKELIPYIDSNYQTSHVKKDKAIAGLSMGGFGAIVLPIKHPWLFGTSLNLSGAVRTQQDFIDMSAVKYHSNFAAIYGDSLRGVQRITQHWLANSPYSLISDTNVQEISAINWYIDCGMDDFLFNSNQSLHHFYLQHNIPHEYHMRQGKHNWAYWESGIIKALVYWGQQLKNK